tara:strand:+ start:1125 stop:1469 length:345 start_codon:yes stop_codon:yes gene_type:complete
MYYILKTQYINKMNNPLLGTPRNNYRFFYTVGGSVIFSLVLLLVITIYSAITIGDINQLITDMNQVINGMNELLPEAQFGAELMHAFCKDGNFTKLPNTGNICFQKGLIPNPNL